MKYEAFKKLLDSRRRDMPYKRFKQVIMQQVDEHTIGFYNWKWEQDKQGVWQRSVGVLLATIDDRNLAAFHLDRIPHKSDQNSWVGIVGFGYAYRDSTTYRNHTHKERFTVRFSSRDEPINVPLTKGLVVNVSTRQIVVCPKDPKVTLNKEADKPLRSFVNKAIRLMEVTRRMGGYEGVYEALDYKGRRAVFDAAPSMALLEENMHDLAQRAYVAARRCTEPVRTPSHYRVAEGREKENAMEVAEAKKQYDRNFRNNAAAKLREALRKGNAGVYVAVDVAPTIQLVYP